MANRDDAVSPGTAPTTKDGALPPSQKAVSIFAEPEHIESPHYGEPSPTLIASSPKAHRASISGKKMKGRPPPQPCATPSRSLNKVPSYLALDEVESSDPGPVNPAVGSTPNDARFLLAQVSEWLLEEKSKRSARTRSGTVSSSTTPLTRPRSDADLDLEKLEQILLAFHASGGGGDLRSSRKSSLVSLRRGSLLTKFHRSSQPGASSDTEWQDEDVNVPHVEASLDNSRTLAYSGGEVGDHSSNDTNKQKDQKCWDQFKQEIIRLTHTLKIRGWRRVPIDQPSLIHVERLSGALTNAVYVVKPPQELPAGDLPSADGSKPYRSTSRPLELLLRIYGPQVEHLIDREEELGILRRLARKRIGPRLLGYFTNGRFEEFLHAKTLTPEDIRVPETSKQIAKRMRELHDGIELLPSERDNGPRVVRNFNKYLDRCEKVITWLDAQVKLEEEGKKPACKRYTRRGLICGVEWSVFRDAYDRYHEKLLEEYGGEAGIRKRLVFAHNDTQYGNLMRLDPPGDSPLLQPANQHRQLVVIDFEYASANTPGNEFANHFTEWCYNYHHPDKSYACNTNHYPTPAEQYRFMRAYVMHRPQFAAAASSTPKMEGREKTNISDFMLDARIPGGPSAVDYDVEEKAREDKVEADIQYLLRETRAWRIENSAQWVAWGIVQAKVPELDEPLKTKAGKLLEKVKGHLVAHSDPLDADVRALKEASQHDRPEGRLAEEAHAEGEPAGPEEAGPEEEKEEEEEEEDFDYLAYAQDRAFFFWGDCLQMGIVKESDLPESLLKQIKIVKF